MDHVAHTISQKRRQRELAAIIAGDGRLVGFRAGDEDIELRHTKEAKDFACEEKRVAGCESGDEIFLDNNFYTSVSDNSYIRVSDRPYYIYFTQLVDNTTITKTLRRKGAAVKRVPNNTHNKKKKTKER